MSPLELVSDAGATDPYLTDAFPRFFMQSVEKKFPGDRDRLARMSLIEEGYPKQVRMAYLAIIGAVSLFLLYKSSN